jgi:hypothetical protein
MRRTVDDAGGRTVNAPSGVPVKLVAPKKKLPAAVDDEKALNTAFTANLQRVRDAAKNWQTGLAGLLTLVTGTLLFKGRAAISDYAWWVRIILGLLVGVGLLFGVRSLWLLLRASFGEPRLVRYQTIADAGGLDEFNFKLATSSIADMKRGRTLALVSAGLVALALVLSWYGPAAPDSPGALVKVTRAPVDTNGLLDKNRETVLCGKLKTDDSQGVLVQVVGDRDATKVDRANLVSVVIVTAC